MRSGRAHKTRVMRIFDVFVIKGKLLYNTTLIYKGNALPNPMIPLSRMRGLRSFAPPVASGSPSCLTRASFPWLLYPLLLQSSDPDEAAFWPALVLHHYCPLNLALNWNPPQPPPRTRTTPPAVR